MTNLSEMLFASLLLNRSDRNGNRRGNPFARVDGQSEDLRAARERAKAKHS